MQVVTRLMGGLGNQLFQYAAGRSVCARLGAELVLDDTLLKRCDDAITYRDFALGAYPVRARRITPAEAEQLSRRVARPWRYLYDLGIMRAQHRYYREPHFHFDPGVDRVREPVILEGYWQSERYFASLADQLREELQPVAPPHPTLLPFAEMIHGQNSVGLHVRRGDYVAVAANAAQYVACDLDYYVKAARFVAERVPDPVFFVFTDTPEWVADQLKLGFPTVCVSSPQSLPAYEDLRLMSGCAHNIIANSSFSWWGAWLNPNPEKVVVAPARWFRTGRDTSDLVPAEWQLL
ncbi:alpha-1,2-fucosyltransferase [Geomonas propionica]|uniref:Alpha-1,2-fucosyltransferase n=1 Tax=Geomonas propionica TaxID=2798582 RepID=A0ABS0YVP8_9BACT|nr:alpha-1,2-fucosyltransferase [Geomonas propionica]MBJ6801938.1 alpha-1,2-fucosyltransferase [Geomonas propionica]